MSNKALSSIIIVGLKHSGKTTMGKLLAQKMNVEFFDTDDVITQMTGLSPRELYSKKGVVAFMLAEEDACRKIAEENQGKQIVVATGGGICDNAPALNELQSLGNFLFLKLDIDYSIKRIENKITTDEHGNLQNMPSYVEACEPKNMAQVHQILEEKFNERFSHYESIADTVVALKNAPIEANFNTISAALGL